MSPDLLSHSWSLLKRHPFLLWLGLGMSLSSLFGTGWRLWLAQVIKLDFAELANLQTIESLLFGNETLIVQQLLLRGLLLAFAQFVLVWSVALLAEAGIITAVSRSANGHQPTFRNAVRQGWQWLGRFFAIDLLVFFPWFLVALLLLFVVLMLALVLASLATGDPNAGTVLTTTGLGLMCIFGLATLLMPVGLVSFWYRLLAFREAIVQGVAGKTAVRQTWQRIRHSFGDVFVLIVMLWGGQTVVLSLFNLLNSPLLTWLTPLNNSGTIYLQATSSLALLLVTLLAWFVRGAVTAFVAIAWTLAYKNLVETG